METPPIDDDIYLLTERVGDDIAIPDLPAKSSSLAAAEKTETQNKSGPEKDGQIWAYLGVLGGVGVSSLAVQTAFELSKMYKDKTVCLIDLDFERGSCAGYLDVVPSVKIEDLNETIGRMDTNLAATFIGNYKNNFSLISAEGEMGGNDAIDGNALLGLLDSVCGMYDFVILDIPPMWRAWTQAAIGAADKFALVSEMRVPALHRTKKLSDFIGKVMSLDTPPHIIINKHERRELSHSVTLKDAASVLGCSDFAQICVDEDTVRAAINCGKPAGLMCPDARYTKSVRSHVHHWLGLEEQGHVEPTSLFKFGAKRSAKQDRRKVRKRA